MHFILYALQFWHISSAVLCAMHCAIGGWAMLDERGLPGADLPIELFHQPPTPLPVSTIQPSLKCSNIWTICGFLARKYSSGWCWANMGELGKLCRRQTFVLKTTFKSASTAKPCVQRRDIKTSNWIYPTTKKIYATTTHFLCTQYGQLVIDPC